LGHVKEPNACSKLRGAGKIRVLSFLPSLVEASRAAWCRAPLEMKELFRGESTISHQAAVLYRPRKATFTFTFYHIYSCSDTHENKGIKVCLDTPSTTHMHAHGTQYLSTDRTLLSVNPGLSVNRLLFRVVKWYKNGMSQIGMPFNNSERKKISDN
jgi:hypothetical protein